ncbi:MAG: YdcF family protein [Candidatus Roizmanbacteria bacterium]|nr:MAG: YdcF family protein [Candidatus Roizmanbacteria bacterium]
MQSIDITIVFGQGPVKPVLLEEELNLAQKKEWHKYKNSKKVPEPEFFCMKQRKYLLELEKAKLKEEQRQQWQSNGFFALKQLGIQNALAAGYALYKGKTKKIILSGGKTIPRFVKNLLPQRRLKSWPSEAYLMKDVITSCYGSFFEKKCGFPIDKAIILEESSTNTLENFAFTINDNPEILDPNLKIGFITSSFHLKRVNHIARIFSIFTNHEQKTAQDLLKELKSEKKLIDNLIWPNIKNISNLQTDIINQHEKRWLLGLSHPDYLAYWLGYLGLVKHPAVIQNALNLLNSDPWIETARIVFKNMGLNFDDYKNEDLMHLSKNNQARYNLLIENLQKLKTPSLRRLPPFLISI